MSEGIAAPLTGEKMAYQRDADGNLMPVVVLDAASLAILNGFQTTQFGDGADGDVTINGAVTLARDMFYNNLTIAAGAALNTNGFRIFVKGTLDLTAAPAGAIFCNGNAGANAVATALGAVGAFLYTNTTFVSPLSGQAGKNGGTTTGTLGGSATGGNILGGKSGQGGVGGNGSSGNGGGAGTTGAVVPAALPYATTSAYSGGTAPNTATGGSSGGSGGGDGTAGGGSGGGGGAPGFIFISAKEVKRASANVNVGIMQVKGGAGGNGGLPAGGNRGGGAGSGGAGGGFVYIMAGSLTGSAHANAIDVSGGKGGDGSVGTGTGTSGTGGQAGFGGLVHVVDLSSGVTTTTDKRAIGGNAAVGTVGGSVVAARANL